MTVNPDGSRSQPGSALERYRPYFMPACVVVGVFSLVAWAASHSQVETPSEIPYKLDDVVSRADAHIENRWKTAEQDGEVSPLTPANTADDLLVLRRLSLALHGTVPSLEEIRQFEADDQPKRLQRWTARMLSDQRFANYFSERLARAYVGADGGQFILYRRDRFVAWLRAQLQENKPYDQIVRTMIASDGLWTGTPAVNFLTAAYNENKFDVNKLTGRSVRAFLGQRLDCAQCHDHKFDERWKQHHFEGLAAFFAQSNLTAFGVADKEMLKGKKPNEYVVQDMVTGEDRVVEPSVPFHPEWLPKNGTRRERLAAWITHKENRRFERATVNRVWALLYGRQYTFPHYPVDDIPDPDAKHELTDTKLLDILGEDFRKHNYDLRRLILVMTSMKTFRLSSSHPDDKDPESSDEAELTAITQQVNRLENHWAVFPISRLRPEQVIGSMIQTNSIRTIDQNSNLLVRTFRFFRENDFVREYGDPGEEELIEQAGTIPQSLLRMNGRLPSESLKATPFSAAGRIPELAGSFETAVETAFLVGLARRPDAEERDHYTQQLEEAGTSKARQKVIEDLYWDIFNSPEFAWNH